MSAGGARGTKARTSDLGGDVRVATAGRAFGCAVNARDLALSGGGTPQEARRHRPALEVEDVAHLFLELSNRHHPRCLVEDAQQEGELVFHRRQVDAREFLPG